MQDEELAVARARLDIMLHNLDHNKYFLAPGIMLAS